MNLLKLARETRKMSLVELAERIGIHRNTLLTYESDGFDTTQIPYNNLLKISRELGFSLARLVPAKTDATYSSSLILSKEEKEKWQAYIVRYLSNNLLEDEREVEAIKTVLSIFTDSSKLYCEQLYSLLSSEFFSKVPQELREEVINYALYRYEKYLPSLSEK